MAEGDTIHRAALRIGALLTGQVPDEIAAPQRRHAYERWPERLAGRAVRSVDAHGKHLFVRFEGDLTFHSHLRMSGAWGVYGPTQRWQRAPSRAWLTLRVLEGVAVQFDGPLLELRSERDLRHDRQLARLGPDVLAERFDEDLFLRRLAACDPRRPIGEALLDQQLVAGIGNIWRAEICFAAGVNPWRPTGELGAEQALALVRLARAAMAESVRRGRLTRPHAVYRSAGLPCPRCGTPIRGEGQGEQNRRLYWCPTCQR
jgi:endonuclease VIII